MDQWRPKEDERQRGMPMPFVVVNGESVAQWSRVKTMPRRFRTETAAQRFADELNQGNTYCPHCWRKGK